MNDTVRIHLVADIHHGPDIAVKKGESALRILDGFVRRTNELRPDLVVDLGDRISDIDRETDFGRERDVARLFSGLDVPLRHIVGNHDVANLTVMDNEKALGASLRSNSLDIGGFHLVFWNANTFIPFPGPCEGALRSDIDWLRSDLEGSPLPSVIFTHFPLVDPGMAGNYYFEDAPEYAFDPNARALRDALASWGHVVLCVSGHVHQNIWRSTDDISFFSLHSLTESFCTPGKPSETWGVLELGDGISISTFGLQPMTVSLPLRERGARWIAGSFRKRRAEALEVLAERRADSLPSRIAGIALDLDGVVWRGNELIPGGDRFISEMNWAGIPITFVTNNASRTRDECAKKLAAFGIPCTPDEFLTSGYATAQRLARIAPRSGVKVLGSDALREEIRSAGLREDDDAPDYIVVSMDESLTLKDLSDAAALLERGVRLVLTDADALLPDENGYRAGCGAIAAFLETCSRRKGTVIGKPEPFLFSMALQRMGTTPKATVMIGDTPGTDIEGAARMGMLAIRVRSGNPDNPERPCRPWTTVDRLEQAIDVILNHNRRLSADPAEEEALSGYDAFIRARTA